MHSPLMSGTSFSKALRILLLLLLPGVQPRFARADDDSRTILAGEVLELSYSPGAFRDSFAAFLDPALDAMKRDGVPDAARDEVRKAFIDWFDQEVKWSDIKPKLVQIYAHDFTEEELRTLLAFLDKPLGQKVISKLPLVMQEGAAAGQQYFISKQDSLNARLAPIVEKYKDKPASQSLPVPSLRGTE
jgi:hypothetical protein